MLTGDRDLRDSRTNSVSQGFTASGSNRRYRGQNLFLIKLFELKPLIQEENSSESIYQGDAWVVATLADTRMVEVPYWLR